MNDTESSLVLDLNRKAGSKIFLRRGIHIVNFMHSMNALAPIKNDSLKRIVFQFYKYIYNI